MSTYSKVYIRLVDIYTIMAYTEVQERNGKKYYYRVKSVRSGDKIGKERIYLGSNLNKDDLKEKEYEADNNLNELSGLLTKEELKTLERVQEEYLKQPKQTLENRYEAFCSLFTYDSNAIEGNTLTLQQTAQLLFDRIVPSKSLREINEVLNHKNAFDYILKYNSDVSKTFILKLHKLVVKDTLKSDLENQVGKFRTVQVFIRGTDWMPAEPKEVPKEMKDLLSWYTKNKNKVHPLVVSAYFHALFELIHPFVDGNGRVGRLILNFILRKNKLPMVNIPHSMKDRYFTALRHAQTGNDLRPLVKLLYDIIKDAKLRF